jgi:hypothetical protein
MVQDTLRLQSEIRRVTAQTQRLASERATQERYLRGHLGFAGADDYVFRFVPLPAESLASHPASPPP